MDENFEKRIKELETIVGILIPQELKRIEDKIILSQDSNYINLSILKNSDFVAKITDTSAFGIPHNNHNKHQVFVNNLSYEQANKLADFLNNKIFK